MINMQSRIASLMLPLIVCLAAALVVWVAPDEQTLGSGIKSVYIHVALIWVGMLGFYLAGALGAAVAWTTSVWLQRWAHTFGWVGLGFFVAGMGASFLAAGINWGGVFWDEPRNRAMGNVIAATLIIMVLIGWTPSIRMRGLLQIVPAGLLLWAVLSTPLTLHPRSPILSSSSTPIRLTFLSLFVLGCVGAWWISWRLHGALGNRAEDW